MWSLVYLCISLCESWQFACISFQCVTRSLLKIDLISALTTKFRQKSIFFKKIMFHYTFQGFLSSLPWFYLHKLIKSSLMKKICLAFNRFNLLNLVWFYRLLVTLLLIPTLVVGKSKKELLLFSPIMATKFITRRSPLEWFYFEKIVP